MAPHPNQPILLVYLGPPSSGGTVQALARLARLWSQSTPDIEIVTYSGRGALDAVDLPMVRIGRGPTSSVSEVRFRDALRHAPDVVRYLHHIRRAVRDRPSSVVLPFLTGSALVTLAATVGLPNRVVVCERNDVSIRSTRWHVRLLRRLLYPRAAAITVNSSNPAASDLLRRISRGRPVHVVRNPHPRDMHPADPENSRVVLAVGRLVEQKGHATLIEAFARIADGIPEWRVVILGEGPFRSDLEARIDRLGLTDRVTLAGQVEDPRPFYASAGLFVLPSDYEGTSNALLEAASAALPCIVTTTAAPATADGMFRIFPPGDVELLARHLRVLCDDEGARRAAGAAARDWLQSQEHDVLKGWSVALDIGELL